MKNIAATNDVWEETVAPSTKTTIDKDLMPHVLIRTADGNFRFTQVDGRTYTLSGTDYETPKWGKRVSRRRRKCA